MSSEAEEAQGMYGKRCQKACPAMGKRGMQSVWREGGSSWYRGEQCRKARMWLGSCGVNDAELKQLQGLLYLLLNDCLLVCE